MTSMLDALKQIEARRPQVRPAGPPRLSEDATGPIDEQAVPVDERAHPVDDALAALDEELRPPAEPTSQAAEPPVEPAEPPEDAEPTGPPLDLVESMVVVEPLVPGWPGWEPVQQVAEPPLFACPPPEDLAVDPAPGPAPTTVARFERAAEREWDLAALLARPVTPQARPYRDLAANILSQLEPGEASAILFAAVSGHSHATATVARLGAVMGPIAEGQILAVDVDLRSPALAGRFAVQADRGVADVLLGSASWEDVVRPSGVEGLALLPGRRQPAADFLAVEPMRRAWLLDELRRRYRLVLLDAGRLPTADASPWARFCEGAYLVVGLGQATAGATRRAAAEIDRRGGRLLGSVLTTPPRAEGRR